MVLSQFCYFRVAQKHLQQQEAKVSKVRLYKAEAGRRLTQASRWLDNLKIYLIPWEAKIRKIESHFGSVVSSYFTFHRWVLGVNITITFIMCLFVVIPEVSSDNDGSKTVCFVQWLADSRMQIGSERYNKTKSIKVMPEPVRARADELSTVWDFGVRRLLTLSLLTFFPGLLPIFITILRFLLKGNIFWWNYQVPSSSCLFSLQYLRSRIFTLHYSQEVSRISECIFWALITFRMALNQRRGNLSSGKTQQYLFNWKAFTGWDYTIGNPETAGNVYMANVIKFREAINDDKQKPSDKHPWLRFLGRFLTNIFIIGMYAFSIWAIMRCGSLKGENFIAQVNIELIQNSNPVVSERYRHHNFSHYFSISEHFRLAWKNWKVTSEKRVEIPTWKVDRKRLNCLHFEILEFWYCIFLITTLWYTLWCYNWTTWKRKENLLSLRTLQRLPQQLMTFWQGFLLFSNHLRSKSNFRSLRQVLTPLYAVNNTPHTYYSYTPVTTTSIPPTSPWTTVLPDFGPFGVYNPKAVVTKDETIFKSPVVETHQYGPNSDWNETTVNAVNPIAWVIFTFSLIPFQ